MCGIAGIIGRVGDENRSALRRMNDAMVHRGPDAHGVWESAPDDGGLGVMLGHRRLAILDLSDAATQPMVDATLGHALVYNGEIYNYVELRDRLRSPDGLPSTGDTAVLLRALAVDGQDAVSSLRGMFAFGFWEARRRELWLARDPLGIKPLYLARNRDPHGPWSVAFASELRALLASGLLPERRLDLRAAASLVWNGFVVGPTTAVEGVELAWPGQLLAFDTKGNELANRRFWSMPHAAAAGRRNTEDLATVLEDGLRLHLASDVPLAVFLSGGIDSSAVANLAQRAARTPIHTFTLAFEEKLYDEGPAARSIAEAIGTQHREVVLTQADFVGGLEAALDSLDQPTFDGLNSYWMSRAIRQAGFTVALVGTGGDELFGGYPSFRELPLLERWTRRAGALPRRPLVAAAKAFAAAMQPSRGAVRPQTRWAKLPDMAGAGGDLLALYQLAYALFLPDFQRELLSGDRAGVLEHGLPASMQGRLREEMGGRSALAAISVLEQRLFLGERLLRDNDAASMAASIEQRLPLVDRTLLENVVGLPDDVRYEPLQRKALLREIGLRGLDPALFERPKRGFVLPFDRWIRLGLGDAMRDTMHDDGAIRAAGLDPGAVRRLWSAFQEGAAGMYWSRVWAVYVLIRWCRRHGVRA